MANLPGAFAPAQRSWMDIAAKMKVEFLSTEFDQLADHELDELDGIRAQAHHLHDEEAF